MGTTDRRRDVTVADEMTTLRGFLQDAREVVVAKVAGLDDDVARARHAGHLDILREQADGTTGFR